MPRGSWRPRRTSPMPARRRNAAAWRAMPRDAVRGVPQQHEDAVRRHQALAPALDDRLAPTRSDGSGSSSTQQILAPSRRPSRPPRSLGRAASPEVENDEPAFGLRILRERDLGDAQAIFPPDAGGDDLSLHTRDGLVLKPSADIVDADGQAVAPVGGSRRAGDGEIAKRPFVQVPVASGRCQLVRN